MCIACSTAKTPELFTPVSSSSFVASALCVIPVRARGGCYWLDKPVMPVHGSQSNKEHSNLALHGRYYDTKCSGACELPWYFILKFKPCQLIFIHVAHDVAWSACSGLIPPSTTNALSCCGVSAVQPATISEQLAALQTEPTNNKDKWCFSRRSNSSPIRSVDTYSTKASSRAMQTDVQYMFTTLKSAGAEYCVLMFGYCVSVKLIDCISQLGCWYSIIVQGVLIRNITV